MMNTQLKSAAKKTAVATDTIQSDDSCLVLFMKMAKKMGYVFLSTSDRAGFPYLSIVQPVDADDRGRLKLMAWLGQQTLTNLQENNNLSVVVWDPKEDLGFQIIAKLDDMEEVAVLDSRTLELEKKRDFPLVEWKILASVEKVLNFQKAPHTDVEIRKEG